MLGKICTVCLLVLVSACLVRPQPASKEKIAGIADDVAALLSKLGAKSTDEAVAKIWAKGDDLSKAEQENLVKLLKSSDGAAALAALQQPVTSKLARLDNMLAEYKKGGSVPEVFRKRMLADLDQTIAEVNAAADRYRKITLSVVLKHHIPRLEYPARQVLEMAKIEGLARVKQLYLVGLPDEIVEANLLLRNFDNLKRFIRESILIHKADNLVAFKKVLTEGNLEDEVYPIYNSLVKVGDRSRPEMVVHSISQIGRELASVPASIAGDMMQLASVPANIAGDLMHVKNELKALLTGLRDRAMLLEKSGISSARKAKIIVNSRFFLKGAGEDGSKAMNFVSMSTWAERNYYRLSFKLTDIGKKTAFTQEIIQERQTIEKLLKEIEQMQ